ncbi:MAG: hypothetical protein K8R54_02920 [Bacteroidales bacterium]|nr:hypothetical protein [Bacteroidales bacterium]
MEAASHLPKYDEKLRFESTKDDNHNRMFNYGCDYVNKKFEEEFEGNFNSK